MDVWHWSDLRPYCENSFLKPVNVILCVRWRCPEILPTIEGPRCGMRGGKVRRVRRMLPLDSNRRLWVTHWMKQGFFSSWYRSFLALRFQRRPAVVGYFKSQPLLLVPSLSRRHASLPFELHWPKNEKTPPQCQHDSQPPSVILRKGFSTRGHTNGQWDPRGRGCALEMRIYLRLGELFSLMSGPSNSSYFSAFDSKLLCSLLVKVLF